LAALVEALRCKANGAKDLNQHFPRLPTQPLAALEHQEIMGSEVSSKADFSEIRYAQCWEDADILLDALDVQPGDVCLSIASAGDNSLALLSRSPGRVVALDLSPAQLACVELRVAAYRELDHPGLLELIGSTPSTRRAEIYRRCRSQLSNDARDFWDSHGAEIDAGIGGAGKFERFFSLFRRRILPLVHSRKRIQQLLVPRQPAAREQFYERTWNTWRWRLLFRIFFSRFVMGRMGRDPSFFAYVEGSVADRILERARYALTALDLDPSKNPYLDWILTGRHTTALPLALRPENFDTIRSHLDRLEWRCQSVEDFLAGQEKRSIDRYNLSDIFEYMSPENAEELLAKIAESGRSGGRLAYWNMLVPRSRPESLADRLRPLPRLARKLHLADKAFFYSRFVVEEIV
jgi:S-adenosylmethionine-diacylglycerol 3-amino-3-carboxypropyl transferase